ncbi:MAG: Ribonuclease 3 [Mycoplasmataceae bacterium]|nr:MAG: Ribonuclease 3 [Mycoplasmataceae bacterium]
MKSINQINEIVKSIESTDNFKNAFIHSSLQNEMKLKISYESLEFLGDSILNFHTTLFIYNKFPDFSEGQMSKLKQLMVKESTLAEISKKISLPKFLRLGEGEKKNGGFEKISILADIFESFLGALYLEKGDKIVYKFLNLTLFNWSKGKETVIWDYKTKLQEYCQSEKNSLFYNLISINEKKNKKEFLIEVKDLLGKINEKGEGKTKKKAEQNAAYNAMKRLNLI